MSKIVLSGAVVTGDPYRNQDDPDRLDGAIHIGEDDLVDEILEFKWSDNVRVTLNGEIIATGSTVAEAGWGYSEYTPMDEDVAKVGDCDLIQRLKDLEGQHVHLCIEDV